MASAFTALACLFAIAVAVRPADAGSPALSQGSSWRRRIDDNHLHLDPAWLALLAYRPLPFHDGWKSEADKPGFFLSAQGSRDPHAEMIADVEALFFAGDEAAPPDLEARCRFPARYTWLKERLGIDAGVSATVQQQCPALGSWYERVRGDRASIAFASAHLESPSSMFGHTFLRFERDGVPTLGTETSNYQADSSRNTGTIAFVARGLFGGFPGIADQVPLYRRLRVYGDIQGRDVWDYPLRLDTKQVELLLLSLWEVRDSVFDYFFLGENCSYRTLALLAVVLPDAGLLEEFPLEVVPVDTIRVLRERGLVGEPSWWPSAVRTFEGEARGLSLDQRRTVAAIARGEQSPDYLSNRPREERAVLLRAAADYSSILIHRGALDFETRDRVTQDLIRARLETGQAPPADPAPPPPSPDQAHGGHMATVGWVNQRHTSGIELGLAGFQHERIDRLAGYERGAEIVVLGGRYRFSENGAGRLENLDLLRIESTTASDLFFHQPAWSLRLGAQRKHVDQGKPLLGTLAASRGIAVDAGLGVLALTIGASLDSGSALRAGFGMEMAGAATLTRQLSWLAVETFVEHGRYVFGDHSHRLDYGLRLGIPLTRRYGLALEFQRGGADAQENLGRLELRTFF